VPLAEQKPDDVGLVHCGETYLLRVARRSAEVLCRDHCVTQVLSASRAAARCSSRPAITSASLFDEQCHRASSYPWDLKAAPG